jgi:hemoglobin
MSHPNPSFAKFDISRDEIANVVEKFYVAVRNDATLGPIFAHSIATLDWPAHEAKITRFWANAILNERDYNGNPMQVHKVQGHVAPEHFKIWLDLFETTLNNTLPAQPALQFNMLARRIGASLKMGLEGTRAQMRGVPNLR